MSIEQQNGRYVVRWRNAAGKQKKHTMVKGATKKAAEAYERERLLERHRGEYRELKKATFEDFAIMWWDRKGGHVRDSTHKEIRSYLLNHLIPFFESRYLTSIDAELIEDYKQAKRKGSEDHRPLSAKSINNHLTWLRPLFDDAVEWGYLLESPMRRTRKLRRRLRPQWTAYDREQVQALLRTLEDKPMHYAIYLTGVMCGLRTGEQVALKWKDYDRERGLLTIAGTGSGDDEDDTKTAASMATIETGTDVSAALEAIWNGADPEDHIFTRESGAPIRKEYVNRAILEPACKAAGIPKIPWKNATRHTMATLMIEAGINLKQIQERIRHRTIQQTADTYAHLLQGASSRVIRTYQGYLRSESARIVPFPAVSPIDVER